jgi:hypothetical protein
MEQASGPAGKPAYAGIEDIRGATRRQVSVEDKIRIVLEGLRGEDGVAEAAVSVRPLIPNLMSQPTGAVGGRPHLGCYGHGKD